MIAATMMAGAVLMALGAWLANVVARSAPGHRWLRPLGWGMPAGVTTLIAGLHPLQALWIAIAVAAGTMVPPTPAHRLGRISGDVFSEALELFLEGVLRLTPVGLVFWACNLYWPKAIEAASLILPCYLVGLLLHARLSVRGARTPTELGALLFAAAIGALLAATPMLPLHPEWPPLPQAISALDQQLGR